MAQVNETIMVNINGVHIQENQIKKVVLGKDQTSVWLKNGISVTYGPQKADEGSTPSIKLDKDGDSVFSNVDGAKIKGTPEEDIIKVWNSKNVEIDTGAGDDKVAVRNSKNVEVDTGAGNDYVIVKSKNVEVDTGAGDDIVEVSKSKNVKADTGAGDDKVRVYYSKNVEVDIGAGNDEVVLGDSNNIHMNINENTEIEHPVG